MVGERRGNTRLQARSRAVALPGSPAALSPPSCVPFLWLWSPLGCPFTRLTSWVPRALLMAVEQESLVKISLFTPREHEGNYV